MTETFKALLRPLRNVLLSASPPEEAPRQTSEERETERNQARIKGFTYLKSMDELQTFNPSLEDPLQRSNIPLLSRPLLGKSEEVKAKTMVVHDFGSAYHDYEANNQCIGVDEAQFSCDTGELRYVETFVYFAHYLVSCPPASWVNLCHGNGVGCLGTFIVEPQMSKEEVGRIFQRDTEGEFEVAEMLGRIARWVGFEGWIVNIEGVFADELWDAGLMVEFLKALRREGMVVWYVDILNTLSIATTSFMLLILHSCSLFNMLQGTTP
jgi:endo-beta-N-acetylglucosaminidase D